VIRVRIGASLAAQHDNIQAITNRCGTTPEIQYPALFI
jgi:hypothetical protein